MIAAAASTTAGNLVGSAFSQVLMSIIVGNFNPTYNKEARKRMRYIQQKYSLAYEGGKAGEDPCGIIGKIDSNSKLLMDPAGMRPANPFPDERAWEDSLVINFHPISGHQGRFVGSHVLPCIGMINDYQNSRRRRLWVPGPMGPGKPNDYINLFLEETKTWLRTQLSLDYIHAEELKKREKFYSNLKHDNYYWCFPNENCNFNIQRVIDFIHEKVKNALEIISREEMNKSLQLLFKELNDHTTNFFEFSKHFLAYLLFPSKKVGANIVTSPGFDGNTIETGKLHFLLTRVTSVVFETYQKDLEITNQKLYHYQASSIDNNNNISGKQQGRMIRSLSAKDIDCTGGLNSAANNATTTVLSQSYNIFVKGYEKTTLPITATVYLIQIEDPKQTKWIVKKTWNDFENFFEGLKKELSLYSIGSQSSLNIIQFPEKKPTSYYQAILNHSEYYETMIELLNQFCQQLSCCIVQYQYPKVQKLIAQFLETKNLLNVVPIGNTNNTNNSVSLLGNNTPQNHLVHGESIPNVFVAIKQHYQSYLVQGHNPSMVSATNESNGTKKQQRFSATAMFDTIMMRKTPNTAESKEDGRANSTENQITPLSSDNNSIYLHNHGLYNLFDEFNPKEWSIYQRIWGPEYGAKILHGYSLLQRIATILGWTLEINHFFISMFGNTLSFSKLPLHDILVTQKELIQQFIGLAIELYDFTCQLNEENQYKFHKNLQMTENELLRVKFHGNKIITLIHTIESDHLDYEAQLRRLKDVHERFQPFLFRIGHSLINIQEELQLNVPNYTFVEKNLLSEENTSMFGGKLMIRGAASDIVQSNTPTMSGKKIRQSDEKHEDEKLVFNNEEERIRDNQINPKENMIMTKTAGGYSAPVTENNTANNSIHNDLNQKDAASASASASAYAIFSRSNSDTVHPAIEKPNPIFAGEELDNSMMVAADPKRYNISPSSQSKKEAESVDDVVRDLNIQYVRNEESSAVCLIM